MAELMDAWGLDLSSGLGSAFSPTTLHLSAELSLQFGGIMHARQALYFEMGAKNVSLYPCV